MGVFQSLFGKKSEPTPNSLRDTLFGDRPIDQWPADATNAEFFPWSEFVEARTQLASGNQNAAIGCWQKILASDNLEPRHYLQAWHFLKQHGIQPTPDVAKQLHGVVVEVAMPKGLDLLAAYPDHSARYYNFSGAGIVWEHPDHSLDEPIDQLLAASREVVAKIGPWEQARPPAPTGDQIRLCFLTPSGLHFGQGPMNVLARDPMGGRVIQLATTLMQALIAKTEQPPKA